MKVGATRFALRETRQFFRSPKTLGVMVAVGLVLGIAGPFDTASAMRLVPRVGYWLAVVVVTLATGAFLHAWVSATLRGRWKVVWVQIFVSGLAIGIAITVELLALNWAAFGVPPFDPEYVVSLAANALAISMIVSGAISFLFLQRGNVSAAATPAPQARLLARLALEKRGAVISLSVEDHYVNVATSNGHSLLLMRLSDAISEVDGTPGLQVHRSHWVALDQVATAKRTGDKAVLTMCDGRDIPVSRTHLKAVRDAGLLAR